MKIQIIDIQLIKENGVDIALAKLEEAMLTDGQAALEFMMNLHHESGCRRIIINKEAFSEAFFDLSTNLAGEILQKFVNYSFKLAIIGDFSAYDSQPLRDFMAECNRGQDIFFVPDEPQARQKLAGAL